MRILFIRYKKSKGVMEGGEMCSQKNFNILRRIVGDGNIDTYYIHDEQHRNTVWDYVHGVVSMIAGGYYFGLTARRMREIVDVASKYDCVFVDRSVFSVIAKCLKETGYKGKVFVFFHNVETHYFKDKIAWWKPWRPLVLHCVDRNDRYACRYADKIIVLNDRDKREIEERYGRRADMTTPIAIEDRAETVEAEGAVMTVSQPSCLFLGAYFSANNEGILWFVENVLPEVDIRLRIVGKGMSRLESEIRSKARGKEVEVISDAPDLTPYFQEADVVVLPIFKGSGMKVKTCECLMWGKNIIGTREAFEGYQVDYEKVGALCNTKDEFIASIRRIAEHPIPRYNRYARETYLSHYTEEAVEKEWRRLWE